LAFVYESKNGTGTGEIDLQVETVDGVEIGKRLIHSEAKCYDMRRGCPINSSHSMLTICS